MCIVQIVVCLSMHAITCIEHIMHIIVTHWMGRLQACAVSYTICTTSRSDVVGQTSRASMYTPHVSFT